MPRFFITASNIFGGAAYLDAKESAHLRALRIRQGESFTVCDGKGTDYTCRLTKITSDGAEAEIVEKAPTVAEPTVECTAYIAFAKGDRLETAVQKSVELGASEIALFPSARCVSRPEALSVLKKTGRLQKIAEEAAKQSGRGKIPRVIVSPSFDRMIFEATKADLPLFFYEDETQRHLKDALEERPEAKTISLVTGPEGGFDPEEAAFAKDNGMVSVSLGPRILRCETAPIAALAAIMYHTGNF
jgi:16S rRNA (uracil1498-N3)-methyltransferase